MKQQLKSILFWWSGLFILILNKPRHALQGYTRPRVFPVNEIDRSLKYDLNVVNSWKKYGEKYLNNHFSWKDRSILELGPGADLGVGITLLAEGAASYHALDVNPLAVEAPEKLYDVLAKHLQANNLIKNQLDIRVLKSKIDYVCDKNFNITYFKNQDIDLIVSNASFEHFSNVRATIAQMSETIVPGGIFIGEVDLQTHSRWIREADPLNIYRYPEWLYKLLSFSGSPNRVRPESYKQWLEEYGWENIVIYPKIEMPLIAVEVVRNGMIKRFKKEKESLGWLSVVICATKKIN